MLRRWIRSWSPLAVGYIAGAGSTGMLSAYDWCVDNRLNWLPTIGGCHCWIVGAGGLFLGLLCAALVPIVHRLLEPLIAKVNEAIAYLALGRCTKPSFVVPRAIRIRRTDPLARRRASRAPPLSL